MPKIVKQPNGSYLKMQEKGDPSSNPKGRGNKGIPNSKTIIRKWLAAAESSTNPITGKKEQMNQLDKITLAQLIKARKGDTASFNALLDRTEGKPQQSLDHTANVKVIKVTRS